MLRKDQKSTVADEISSTLGCGGKKLEHIPPVSRRRFYMKSNSKKIKKGALGRISSQTKN